MKKILFLALAAVLTSTACKDNTPNRFDGVIVDASMNTVTVKALTGDDTYTFSLDEADKTDANGLLIGNLISVSSLRRMPEITAATQVATDATYAKAIGKWTMPDPINLTKRMGVELQIEGKAGSINMATLPIESWELQGEADKVILKGRSIGNGQTSDYTQTATIVEKDGKTFLSPTTERRPCGKRKLSGCEPLVFPKPRFQTGLFRERSPKRRSSLHQSF